MQVFLLDNNTNCSYKAYHLHEYDEHVNNVQIVLHEFCGQPKCHNGQTVFSMQYLCRTLHRVEE